METITRSAAKTTGSPGPLLSGFFRPAQIPEGTLRRSESTLLFDESRERLIRFHNRSIYPDPNKYTIDVARLTNIQIEISRDEGRTFSPPRQLIAQGYDATEWAPGVRFGENSSMISFCQPVLDRAGRIILPAHWLPVLPPDHTEPYRPFPLDSVCFFGETVAGGEISWSMSERVAIDPALSTRGLCEPTVSEISGGRMLMVCRGSNYSKAAEMPGRKWMAVSTDDGRSWSQAKSLDYDTGESFYSPATGSRLIRSSLNGRLYWIGNIVPENPDGNWPRHPLCIAEVDEESLALRKETVFKIDERCAEDSPRLQLSNFHVYEDRVTGEFVLKLARLFERSETSLVSPAYEYRIDLNQID